jgi:hypothetical protein
MLRIMGVFAGLFVENLKENVRAALAHRATVKGLPTCRPAFGYTYPGDDHPWEMEEDEAGVVRQIFRRYADGWILQDLTRWLNDEEIPRKHGGEHWWPRTVWQMLHNPVYIGQFRQRGEVIDAEHPPLINADLWHLVQARLALNAEIHPKGRKSQSLGPILHCGYCGSRLCLSAHHRKGSGTLGRYSCHTRLVLPPDQRHAAVGVTAPKAAAAVWAYVEWLFREDVLLQASERHVKHMAARQESGAGAQTRKRVEEIDRALAKSLRAFQVGAIDEDLLARENKGLLEEKKGLKRSLDEAQTPPAYREILERLSGLSAEQAITELRKASADRQLAVLGLLFEKVEVFPGYLVFHHRGGLLPLATVPLPKLYAPKRGLTEIVIPPDPYATTWTFTIPD